MAVLTSAACGFRGTTNDGHEYHMQVKFEIEATNTLIKVNLNGQLVTNFPIPANTNRSPAGHIGLQCHTGNVQFQNVMLRSLPN